MNIVMRSLVLGSVISLLACAPAPAPEADAPPAAAGGSAAQGSAQQPPQASAPAPDSQGGAATWEGYGPLRFGMSQDAARSAWDGPLQGGDAMDGSTCVYLYPGGAEPPASPGFMFENGRLVRYDISDSAAAAPGGGRVGMEQADIERLYPGIESQPHKYTDGRYLRAVREEYALVFETDGAGKVTRWRVGYSGPVDYVEGCA